MATRYWIASLPVQSSASSLWSNLQEFISKRAFDTPLYRFNTPDLRVGTLDSLLSLSGDLAKSNAFIEGVSHKIRRQIEELERASGIEGSVLTVDGVPVDSYLTSIVASSSSSSSSSTTSSSHYSSLSFIVVSPSHNDLMRPRPSFRFEGSVEERELIVQSKPLMKSQSLVFTRDRKEESKENEEEKEKKKKKKEKKKGRFWSRLLSGSSKRREEGVASLHSKTFKRNLLPTGFH